jgi:hypothetical protein
MYLILFLVGIVLGFTGIVLVHLSVPVIDVAGAALFNSGIIAIVGGLILMGLGAVVRSVSRIAERLEMQPVPLPPIAAVEKDDPAPRPARPAPVVAAPAAKRGSLLAWFGTSEKPANGAKPEPAPAEPPAPPVDLAPLTRVEEPRVAVPPAATPPVTAAPPPPPVPPKPAPVVRPPVKPPAPAAQAANGAPETTVYKSGVIDGMAYSLYMDGSIEAELPQGKVRFGSVDELQKYLTTRQ